MSLDIDFKQFCKDRIRSVRDGYSELMTEKVPLKEIKKAYNRWAVLSGKRQFAQMTKDTQAHFIEICEENFGDSRGTNIYQGFRVFLDEEDLEDFDKEHEKELHLPTNQSLDEIALLKAEIKRRDDVIDAVKSLNKIRNKELIKIINSLKTLLTLD